MNKNNTNKKNHTLAIGIYLIVTFVLVLTVGFSAYETTLYVDDLALDVRPHENIRVTNVIVDSKPGSTKTDHDFNKDNIHGTLNLKEANSTITYKVEITNFGNVEMGIFDIYWSEQHPELKDILDIQLDQKTEYIMREKICEIKSGVNQCSSGIKKDIYVTIKYKEGAYNSDSTEFSFILNFDFRPFYKVTYTNMQNHNYPEEIIEGGNIEVTFTRPYPVGIKVFENGSLKEYEYEYNTIKVKSVKNNLELRAGYIQAIEDLVNLSENLNAGENYSGVTFIMERDLDFKSPLSYRKSDRTDYGDINGINGTEQLLTELTTGSGFVPIGNDNNRFNGIFDGGKYTLSNLYINSDSRNKTTYKYVGIFGVLENSTVKNFKVNGNISVNTLSNAGGIASHSYGITVIDNCHSNVSILNSGETNSHGGIVGDARGNTIIKDSSSTSTINGAYHCGGLIGFAGTESEISIINSNNYGIITEPQYTAGGLVGTTNGSKLIVENSNNYYTISSTMGKYLGGLLGEDRSGAEISIKNSHNEGLITSNSDTDLSVDIGGLIGISIGNLTIENSYNTGEIKNIRTSYAGSYNINIGGLVGDVLGSSESEITNKIINSYNEGNISGGNRVSGIVGYSRNYVSIIINKCYNKGTLSTINVTPTISSASGGGLIGYAYNGASTYILNSYNMGIIDGYWVSGLFGATHQSTKTYIINSYNTQSIKGERYSNGLFMVAGNSSTPSTIYTNNIYNLGKTETGDGTSEYSLGWLNITGTKEANISNSYYLTNTVSSNQSNIGTVMTVANMKSQSFVNTLNGNISSDGKSIKNTKGTLVTLASIDSKLSGYTLSKWTLGSSGYPELVN